METLLKRLTKTYPDINDVVALYNDMVEKHKLSDPGVVRDDKYRPIALLIALQLF